MSLLQNKRFVVWYGVVGHVTVLGRQRAVRSLYMSSSASSGNTRRAAASPLAVGFL